MFTEEQKYGFSFKLESSKKAGSTSWKSRDIRELHNLKMSFVSK